MGRAKRETHQLVVTVGFHSSTQPTKYFVFKKRGATYLLLATYYLLQLVPSRFNNSQRQTRYYSSH